LILGQSVSTNELHNFVKLSFFLENVSESSSETIIFWVNRIEIGFQGSFVIGVGNGPVYSGEMLSLGEFFVKTPENLDDLKGSNGYRISEITTWWGHSTNNRNCTQSVFSFQRSQASNLTSSFVELGEFGLHISGITLISWHFCETTRDFSQGLGPTRGGVGHHTHIVPLISEVLSQGDTSINGGFPGSDGHIRGVSHQAGSLHNTLFLSFVILDGEFWEIMQDLCHFVSSFTTTDINNNF